MGGHLVQGDVCALAGRYELSGHTVNDPDKREQSRGGSSNADDVDGVDEAMDCVVPAETQGAARGHWEGRGGGVRARQG